MIDCKIDNLRDKLNLMIVEIAEYYNILKISQKLDELIVQYYINKVNKGCSGYLK